MSIDLADREAQDIRKPKETAGFAAAMDRMHMIKPSDDRVIPAEPSADVDRIHLGARVT